MPSADKPYSAEDIDLFVDSHLRFGGATSEANAAAHRARFAARIMALPPWQQVMLVEVHAPNIVAEGTEMSDLGAQAGFAGKAVLGFFKPGTLSNIFNGHAEVLQNTVVWSADTEERDPDSIFAHEEGHRLDHVIAPPGSNYASEASPAWCAAVDKELALIAARNSAPKDNLPEYQTAFSARRWLQQRLAEILTPEDERIPSEPGDEPIPAEIYAGQRSLDFHLSLYDDKQKFPSEAFAEVTAAYSAAYIRFGGDEKRVGRVMKAHFPALWPIYNEVMIEAAIKHAAKLWQYRLDSIDEYDSLCARLYTMLGAPSDPQATRAEAQKASMEGDIGHRLNLLRERVRLFENPVDSFVRAAAVRHGLRADFAPLHDGKNSYAFDEDAARSYAQDILAREGLRGIVERHDSLFAENRALSRFANLQISMAKAVGIPKVFLYEGLLQRFDDLKAAGGVAQVKALCDVSPSQQTVIRYMNARIEKAEERVSVVSNGSRSSVEVNEGRRRQIFEELQDLIRKGGTKAVERATEDMIAYRRSLHSFAQVLDNNALLIGDALAQEAPYYEGRDVLRLFENLYAEQGSAGVADFVERVRLNRETVNSYITAREDWQTAYQQIAADGHDISWGRKGGLYRPFSMASKDFPPGFFKNLAREVMDMALDKGREHIQEHDIICRRRTHNLIAAAVEPLMPPARRVGPVGGGGIA